MVGIGKRKLSELSDDELAAEARRRRIKRNGAAKFQLPPRHIRRHLAALELSDTASRDEVEKAYHRLLDKYDPEKRRGDDKKYDAAMELTRSLTRAYRKAKEWFEEQQKK